MQMMFPTDAEAVDVRVLRPIMNTKSGLLLFGAFEKTNISAGQETHIDVVRVGTLRRFEQ